MESSILCNVRSVISSREQISWNIILCTIDYLFAPANKLITNLIAGLRRCRQYRHYSTLVNRYRRITSSIFFAIHKPSDATLRVRINRTRASLEITIALSKHKTAIVCCNQVIQFQRLTRFLTPDKLCQIRVVNKWVAVTLRLLNTIVAVYLFLRNRVLAVPFHQECHAIFGQTKRTRRIVSGECL